MEVSTIKGVPKILSQRRKNCEVKSRLNAFAGFCSCRGHLFFSGTVRAPNSHFSGAFLYPVTFTYRSSCGASQNSRLAKPHTPEGKVLVKHVSSTHSVVVRASRTLAAKRDDAARRVERRAQKPRLRSSLFPGARGRFGVSVVFR